jgi:hypothetical protein
MSSNTIKDGLRPARCGEGGRRGDSALKAMYLALAQQWLESAVIGDAADQERAIERE